MLKKLKRLLYLVHRWLGVVMCLWFMLLFATGIIMMYVEYPELTEDERIAQLEPLDPGTVRLSAEKAAQVTGSTAFDTIVLRQLGGRPAYALTDDSGRLTTVFADNGELFQGWQPAQAVQVARHSGFFDGKSAPHYDGLIDMDQWTVSSALHASRPLHRVALNDDADTVLYISDRNGQVVRDTNRTERLWNWLGSTIHWIYPWQLRKHADAWAWLLTYLSLAGVLSVASGAVIGYWRLRVNHRYRDDRMTPYRGFQQWHHVLGLGFLLFISTWMFSGLMSMSPWGLFDNITSEQEQIARYQGGALTGLSQFPDLPAAVADAGKPVKEVEWHRIGNQRYLVLAYAGTDKRVLMQDGVARPETLQQLVTQALPRLQPDAALEQQAVVRSYDSYYYSHHNRYRPLPALYARFADPERSWYYIDLNTGAVVQRLTATDRWARWLYNGMHSLDFALLLQHRPWWDITTIVLCLCGFGFSITTVVLGWRRLRKQVYS